MQAQAKIKAFTEKVVASAPGKSAKPDAVPKAAHIGSNHRSVLVVQHGDELDYVLFYPGEFNTSSTGSQNEQSYAWVDAGGVKTKDGRYFAFRRTSTDPFHLQINGQDYDLRMGRVLQLLADGNVEQLKLFPGAAMAKDPDKLESRIATILKISSLPDHLRLQLELAEAQLQDLLKTHAPTHSLVVDVKRSIEEYGAELQKLEQSTPTAEVPPDAK
jgi:hypothetical protein